jgi:hypothetical protein
MLDLPRQVRIHGCEAPGVVVEAATGGVRVEGRRLRPGERRLLRPGGWARAGDVRISAAWDDPGTATGARAVLRAALLGDPAGPGPHLVALEGPQAGRRLPAREGVLGRGRGASIRIDDPTVSRSHLHVRLDGDRVLLREAGSRNGSWIGRTRIRGPRVLAPGEEVRAGRTVLALHVAAGGDERRPAGGPAPARRLLALLALLAATAAAALLLA